MVEIYTQKITKSVYSCGSIMINLHNRGTELENDQARTLPGSHSLCVTKTLLAYRNRHERCRLGHSGLCSTISLSNIICSALLQNFGSHGAQIDAQLAPVTKGHGTLEGMHCLIGPLRLQQNSEWAKVPRERDQYYKLTRQTNQLAL